MHPKGLVIHFQKMVTIYYAMVYCLEILEFEEEEFLIF